ncbi:4-hydroxy-3-methylbut-2-enyl diphosphate reductase [Desulfobulbus elongatus]|uniref:4-hydroxy-3-methylbut-2-enyl diphosphate reductase n=1 Tax=Desulfobulbus elongatus TaxID=53332 RepID=UPI000489368D|nr:4-hydroxy-3-methylbut-2-enyl diphosphate reductase [Desulfobulbus elongatus]
MDIVLANPRGFCAGVNRAIAIVHQALERYQPPVYVLHEIVHNTHVLEELRQRGAVFVEELEQIPQGAVTIFSAHGVSRAVEDQARALGLRTIDATCPLVSKVHRRMNRLHEMGYDVLVIGHKGHPEVEGTCGQASGPVHVLSTPAEIAALEVADPAKVGYVTQTTLSVDDTAELLKALRLRFPLIAEPERTDICYATTNRQAAVRRLADMVDLVLIVGSKNSSNSNRLREVARLRHTPAHLIDDAGEIDPRWFAGVHRVGISAGASAPEHLVAEVVRWLQGHGAGVVSEMTGQEERVSFLVPDLHV